MSDEGWINVRPRCGVSGSRNRGGVDVDVEDLPLASGAHGGVVPVVEEVKRGGAVGKENYDLGR